MKKISKKADCERLAGLPPPVQFEIEKTVALLNYYYGENRNADKDLGGYVVLIEDEQDFAEVEKFFSCKINDVIPEWVNIIECRGKAAYICSLCLISCDFSIVLVIPYSITPHSFLECENSGGVS